MKACPDCGFVGKTPAGLGAHRRRKHPAAVVVGGPNVQAIAVTLAELARMGRLEKVDSARVQALRSMAASLDENPFNSQMWREYREAIGELTADDGDDGSVDDLVNELSSPVRNPPPS